MKQITVKANDPYKFAEIALLVDQPWLEPIILQLRKEFGINSLIPYEKYNEFYKQLLPVSEYQDKSITEKLKTLQKKLSKQFMKTGDFSITKDEKGLMELVTGIHAKQTIFEIKVIDLLKDRVKNIDVRNMVKKAIVCGEVREQDLKHKPNRRLNPHNIQRDRIMYWLKIRDNEPMTYEDVADEILDDYPDVTDADAVRKQVDRYEDRLSNFSA